MTRSALTSRLAAIGVLCTAVATLAGQDSRPAGDGDAGASPQSTLVAGTQYVRVDLYVTRDGRLVEDLRPDEIALFEDGVPQTIDTFERIAFRRPDPFEPPIEPRTLEASRAFAADPRSRTIVVFLDLPGHVNHANAVVSPEFLPRLVRTLDQALGPDDMVAAMTSAMRPDDLTFSRTLKGLPALAVGPDETEMLYRLCYPPRPGGLAENPAIEMTARRAEAMTLDALESLVAHLGGLREERKAVLLVTEGWPVHTPSPTLMGGNPRRPEQPAQPRSPLGGPLGGGGAPTDGTLIVTSHRGVWDGSEADRSKCEGDRAALANLDHRGRLFEIIGRANRNNVSFYPVSPAGLTAASIPFGDSVRSDRSYENLTRAAVVSMLRDLAEQTDGYAIVTTNDLSGGIERMMADSSAYYLIGYQSTNAVFDGTYRRITVTVDRPGAAVRARPGYHATPVVPRETVQDLVRPPTNAVAAAISRLASARPGSPLHLAAAAWTAPRAGTGGAIWLVGEIDGASRRDAQWAKGAAAGIEVHGADGTPVFRAVIDVPAQRPAFALRVPAVGTLPPGGYAIRVHLAGSDSTAEVSESIHVTVPVVTTPLGEAVLWRRGPFSGPQPVPTADARFRRQEWLRLELPAFGNDPVTARLLDRTGALLPVPLTMTEHREEAEAFRRVVVELRLAPLAPGEYVVEATQGSGSAARATAFRLVP